MLTLSVVDAMWQKLSAVGVAATESAGHHLAVEAILDTLVVAIFLGIMAQLFAHRLRLPAILPLLLLGMGAGPHGLGLFEPGVLGATLEAFIHLGVAVILFEGGLDLEPHRLRKVGSAVTNLLSIGVAVTGVGAACLARWLIDLPWPTAALFGAIVTVTGPTVIAPLLRHMVAPKEVRTVLVSEGLIVDPIGAVLAYLVLQWIGRHESGATMQAMATEILFLAVIGVLFGCGAGLLARWMAKNRHAAGELRNLVILALLLGTYAVSEAVAPQSGILASVVMGLTLAAAEIPDLVRVKAFKGQLTVLIISVLFILLSGQLDLGAVRELGWNGVLVTAGLVLLIRPLSVLLSMPGGKMGWREKALLGLTAPRGIVAAAVASLAAIQLRQNGQTQAASDLEGLVYLTILVTCTWATAMALVLPRALGYLDDPSRRLIVMVGANPLAASLAKLFVEHGWTLTVIDSSPNAPVDNLRKLGARIVRGDARSASTYEQAGLERDSFVLALTPNDELNLLVANLVREEFGVEHPVVSAQKPSKELGNLRMAWVELLGHREMPVATWIQRLTNGVARCETMPLPSDSGRLRQLHDFLHERPEDCLLLCGWTQGKPVFHVDLERLGTLEELTFLTTESAAARELEPLRQVPAQDEPAAEETMSQEASDSAMQPEQA